MFANLSVFPASLKLTTFQMSYFTISPQHRGESRNACTDRWICIAPHLRNTVLVDSGCCNKMSETEWLQRQTFTSHRFGDSRSRCWLLQFMMKVLFMVCFSWPPSCCVLTWQRERALVSSSFYDINPVMGLPPSWPHNSVTSPKSYLLAPSC